MAQFLLLLQVITQLVVLIYLGIGAGLAWRMLADRY